MNNIGIRRKSWRGGGWSRIKCKNKSKIKSNNKIRIKSKNNIRMKSWTAGEVTEEPGELEELERKATNLYDTVSSVEQRDAKLDRLLESTTRVVVDDQVDDEIRRTLLV